MSHASEAAMALGTLLRSYWHIDMGCEPKSFVSYVGLRLICAAGACTSIQLRAGLRAYTPCTVLNFGPCGIAGQEPLCVRDRGWYASDNSLVLANGSTNGQSRKAALPCPSAHAQTFNGL